MKHPQTIKYRSFDPNEPRWLVRVVPCADGTTSFVALPPASGQHLDAAIPDDRPGVRLRPGANPPGGTVSKNSYKGPLDYIDVATRIVDFREKHPEGSLQQVKWEVVEVAGRPFVAFTAAAYRTPDDPRPGIGTAWEPVPGPTNFTRDSELQNAETAAWGRAIVAALAADTKPGIASSEEVRNRQKAAERDWPKEYEAAKAMGPGPLRAFLDAAKTQGGPPPMIQAGEKFLAEHTPVEGEVIA